MSMPTPRSARPQSRFGVMSPSSSPSAVLGGGAGERKPAIGRWPRSASPRHNAPPMNPAAPVTRIRATVPPAVSASGCLADALKRTAPRGQPRTARVWYFRRLSVLLTRPAPTTTALKQLAEKRPKLLFLATEDWYFWSDRLPFARALREAGCDIAVAARVQAHGERIRAERFALYPLGWRRSGDGLFGAVRALRKIIRLYRAEWPDIVNHLALKPVLFGGLARRLALGRGRA